MSNPNDPQTSLFDEPKSTEVDAETLSRVETLRKEIDKANHQYFRE